MMFLKQRQGMDSNKMIQIIKFLKIEPIPICTLQYYCLNYWFQYCLQSAPLFCIPTWSVGEHCSQRSLQNIRRLLKTCPKICYYDGVIFRNLQTKKSWQTTQTKTSKKQCCHRNFLYLQVHAADGRKITERFQQFLAAASKMKISETKMILPALLTAAVSKALQALSQCLGCCSQQSTASIIPMSWLLQLAEQENSKHYLSVLAAAVSRVRALQALPQCLGC